MAKIKIQVNDPDGEDELYVGRVNKIDNQKLKRYKTLYLSYSKEANKAFNTLIAEHPRSARLLTTLADLLRVNSIFIETKQDVLAAELKTQNCNISQSFKVLQEHPLELVFKVKNSVYCLNPVHIWRCSHLTRTAYLMLIESGVSLMDLYSKPCYYGEHNLLEEINKIGRSLDKEIEQA